MQCNEGNERKAKTKAEANHNRVFQLALAGKAKQAKTHAQFHRKAGKATALDSKVRADEDARSYRNADIFAL